MLAPAVSPSRDLTPLPSKTHGPSLFLGVIGPSPLLMNAGCPGPVGDGVLVVPGRAVTGIDELALRLFGMPMGTDVALRETLRLLGGLGSPKGPLKRALLRVADMLVVISWLVGGGRSTSCMVISMTSVSYCAGSAGAGMACSGDVT